LTNRLTKYLRTTQQLIEEGRDAVSSKELGDFTGINPVQVRRDLNAIGFSGTRGVGYQAYDLVEAVRSILGLRQTYNIALVGAGNLGSAIASSTILPKRGFVIHDVFDNDLGQDRTYRRAT
jgi:redox-sensing transcriptional repressor